MERRLVPGSAFSAARSALAFVSMYSRSLSPENPAVSGATLVCRGALGSGPAMAIIVTGACGRDHLRGFQHLLALRGQLGERS